MSDSEEKSGTDPSVDRVVHTPGPWKVSGVREPDTWWQDDVMTDSKPSRRICNVYSSLANPIGLANAKLIAAAPDLLEACESALHSCIDTQLYLKLEAAINKALGE